MASHSAAASMSTTGPLARRIDAESGRRPGSMLPVPELLPDVLPTARLTAKGMAVPELRSSLRRISNLRNAWTVLSAWLQTLGVILAVDAVVDRTGWWPLHLVSFVAMGRGHGLFGILGHESAHRLLFSNQRLNDLVGTYMVNCPTLVSQAAYRRSHMAHHRDPLGPNEPDKTLYAEYPITKASFRRKLRRDAFFESGIKLLRALLRALKAKVSRRAVIEILVAQVVIACVLTIRVGWWAWPVLWLAPWMTLWRVINRLRAIAEHGGMTSSADERLVTHHVRQGLLARFWMVPYNTGWHVAHHVDAGIPFRNLPVFHKELVAAGYLLPELEYPSYRALWRRLSSRPA
jgi:fatty acid desaturase